MWTKQIKIWSFFLLIKDDSSRESVQTKYIAYRGTFQFCYTVPRYLPLPTTTHLLTLNLPTTYRGPPSIVNGWLIGNLLPRSTHHRGPTRSYLLHGAQVAACTDIVFQQSKTCWIIISALYFLSSRDRAEILSSCRVKAPVKWGVVISRRYVSWCVILWVSQFWSRFHFFTMS